MNWIITENNKKINAFDIPTISIEEIKADVEKMKMRVVVSSENKNLIM